MKLSALKKGIRCLRVKASPCTAVAQSTITPVSNPGRRAGEGARRSRNGAMTCAIALTALLLCAGLTHQAAASLESSGWTTLVPSADSRIIYVSDSEGSDSNDGMSPQTPVKTLAKGYALLRNGHPDWLLLKRGDTFTNQSLKHGWDRSGRSGDEPMVVSSYGESTQRPKILSPGDSMAISSVNGTHKHLAFVGLHFEPYNRGTGDTPRAIRWLANTENFLVEDCYIGGYRDNMAFQTNNGSVLKNVQIRRNVIVDSWSTSSHSQGIYAKGVHGLLIEENVFDHNGWNPDISGANATIYNHNMYLQYGESTNVVVRGNIVARGSATGIQQRTGGLCENNLLLRNPTNILFGHFQASWPSDAATGHVRYNVVFDSHDINGSPRGFGIWFQKVDGVEAYGNIIARQEMGTGNVNGIFADYDYKNLTIRDNVIYDWKGGRAARFGGSPGGNITVKNNSFQHHSGDTLLYHDVSLGAFAYNSNTYFSASSSAFNPGSSFNGWVSASGESGASWGSAEPTTSCEDGSAAGIPEYMECLGLSGGIEAFLSEARKQSRLNWRPEFTAGAVNRAVRTSYGVSVEAAN